MQGRTIICGKLLALSSLAIFIVLSAACFTIVADDTRPPGEDTSFVSQHPGTDISSSSNVESLGQGIDASYELFLIAYPEEGAEFLLDPKPDSWGAYPAGTAVTIDVLPRPGWKIAQWLGSVYGVSGGIAKINMDQDQTVLVRLAQVGEIPNLSVASSSNESRLAQASGSQSIRAFALTVNGILVSDRFIELDNGTIEVSPESNGPRNLYLRDTQVKLAAVPDRGYRFAGWRGDCAGDGDVCLLTLNGDINVEVSFEPAEQFFSLAVVSDSAHGGEVEASPKPNGPGNLYLAGTTVKLKPVAEKGFRFRGWEGDCARRGDNDNDDDGGNGNRCEVLMNENKRIVATFSRKE